MDNPTIKLDFGSGHSPKEGFKTCDVTNAPYLDYVFDPKNYTLSCPDQSVSELHCRNVLHHVRDLDRLFVEFKRKLTYGAKITIIEPRRDFYQKNVILDTLWYRYVIPRYEIWIANRYRNYLTTAEKYFMVISLETQEEKEIVTLINV